MSLFPGRLMWASSYTSLYPPDGSLPQSLITRARRSQFVLVGRSARADGPGGRLRIPKHRSASWGRGGRGKMLPEPRVKALGGSAPPAIHLECKRGRDGSEETSQRTSSLRQVLAGPGTLSSSVCVASQGRHRVEVIRDDPGTACYPAGRHSRGTNSN